MDLLEAYRLRCKAMDLPPTEGDYGERAVREEEPQDEKMVGVFE